MNLSLSKTLGTAIYSKDNDMVLMLLSGDGLPWPPVGLGHRSGNQDARGNHRCCQVWLLFCLCVCLFVKFYGANKIEGNTDAGRHVDGKYFLTGLICSDGWMDASNLYCELSSGVKQLFSLFVCLFIC